MTDSTQIADAPPSLTQLVGGIVTDVQTLLRQELQLAKTEVLQEWTKTKAAARLLMAGTALLIVGLLLLCLMLVYLLQRLTGLELWACFAIVGAAFALGGGALLGWGGSKAADVNVIPPQTAETLKENVRWLKNPT